MNGDQAPLGFWDPLGLSKDQDVDAPLDLDGLCGYQLVVLFAWDSFFGMGLRDVSGLTGIRGSGFFLLQASH